MAHRDTASDQLKDFKEKKTEPDTLLNSWGSPVVNKNASLTVGPWGPMLMQDNDFMDEMAHFTRERIPERVVHAKGAGAFGYFEAMNDISEYCASSMFTVGKKTPIAVRFSQVTGELGSADTVRDPRGFAWKFYTEDGIWDLVGNNTPIFFIRDPVLFPSFIHTQKRNPQTHLRDPDALWDFMSLRPETTHQYVYLFGDRGIPLTYRNMNGYGSHTFKLVNNEGTAVYCKFHYKTDQGVKNMDVNEAQNIAGSDPDYHKRDLYDAIADGNYPSWTLYIQVMTFEEAKKSTLNPFDLTKVWPHADYPLKPVGKLVLNRNATNFFAEIEQLAFSPSNLIPGIEPSPDKMLQGRLLAYTDTHRYRLGTNYQQLPVNCPYRSWTPKNYERDGLMTINNQGGAPNYYPNSFNGPAVDPRAQKLQPKFKASGDVYRYDTGDEDNFSQPRKLYLDVFDDAQRERFITNVANQVCLTLQFIQDRVVSVFSQVDETLGKRLKEELDKRKYNKSCRIRSPYRMEN